MNLPVESISPSWVTLGARAPPPRPSPWFSSGGRWGGWLASARLTRPQLLAGQGLAALVL